MTYMATPLHKNPYTGSHEIYNFAKLFLDHLTLLSDCLIYAWEKRKRFKEIMHFHYMTFMATPLHKNSLPGVMKITVLVDPF